LHGLTNQAQLIPSSHHSPSGMSSQYMNANVGGGNFGVSSSIVNTQASTGGRNQNNICCLIDDGRKCNRGAGNASYNKRVQKTVLHKRLRLETDPNIQHIYICDYHKMVIQTARTRQKKDSDEDINDGNPDDVPEVDLYQLQVNTLRRYKKHYKISSRPGLNKAQLADILMRHFKTIPVQEKEIVTYFIYMVKAERNKLDNNRPDPLQSSAHGQLADYQTVRYT
jgi:histone deacetylase complex subunit SAP30